LPKLATKGARRMSKTDREICILKWEQRFNYELDRLDPGNISHQRPFLKIMIKNTIEDLQAEIEQLKAERDALIEKVTKYQNTMSQWFIKASEEKENPSIRLSSKEHCDGVAFAYASILLHFEKLFGLKPIPKLDPNWQPKEQGE
jgi:hypothetical protein